MSKGWQKFICILEDEILVSEVQSLRVRHKRLYSFLRTCVISCQFSYFTRVIYRIHVVMFSVSILFGVHVV